MGTYERAKQRTRDKIRKAFWELYKERRIERITIKDIAEECGIHRATFYLHYADVYEILEEIESRLWRELQDVCADRLTKEQGEAERFVLDCYMLYQNNWEYLHVLLREQKDQEFADRYKNQLLRTIFYICNINIEDIDSKTALIIEMTFSGVVDMFIFWADEPQFSYDDMVGIIRGYMREGVTCTLQKAYGVLA